MATQHGLGRGLGELFARTTPEPEQDSPVDSLATAGTRNQSAPSTEPRSASLGDGSYLAELHPADISTNPKQPRQVFSEEELAELSASIQEVGVLQPIVVRPVGEGRYELVMGERRLRAATAAGLATIPAIVRATEEADLLRDALLENLHRVQLNPLEEAAAYQQMLSEFDCTQEELSSRVQRSRSHIANTIRLLNLAPAVQRRVAAGVLSAGHARALLGVTNPAAQERLAARIVAEGLSVRSVEEIVALGESELPQKGASPAHRERPASEVGLRAQTDIGDWLDTRVTVTVGRNKGRIVVEFADEDDLARIVSLIAPKR